jgi:hypothetical protein
MQDGTVWAWGWNADGQLGDGTTADRFVPAPVSNLTQAKAIAIGPYQSLAVRDDGTVWQWGRVYSGRPEDSGRINHRMPVQVPGLDSVVMVASGIDYGLALKFDGTVWAWGTNNLGQLGDGSTTPRPSPVQLTGLPSAVAIAAVSSRSLALLADGTVWQWGDLASRGSPTIAPVQVGGLANVRAIAAGDYHALALRADGAVWTWGTVLAKLSDGTWVVPATSAVPILGLSQARLIAAGGTYSAAIGVPPLRLEPGATVAGMTSLTVSWSSAVSGSTDWIGLYNVESGGLADWMYVNCARTPGVVDPTGACVTSPVGYGRYEARLFANDSNWQTAQSRVVPLVPAAPTVAFAAATGITGEPITVSWTVANDQTRSLNNWLGLYPIGTPDNAPADWTFVRCDGWTIGATAAGTCHLTATQAGTYEARLFWSDSYTRLATSPATIVIAGN